MNLQTVSKVLAGVTVIFVTYAELSASQYSTTLSCRFGIPIVMIGGMLKENCTVGEDDLCWSEGTKAYVLGSYFYGYCAQFLAVSFAKKYNCFLPGYRFFIVLAIIAQFVYPMLAEKAVTVLIIVQAIRGVFGGLMAAYNIEFLNNWLTVKERKYFLSCVGMSIHIGNGTGGLLASFFLDFFTWKWYFYFGGVLLSIGLIMNILFVSRNPEKSLFAKTFIATEPEEDKTVKEKDVEKEIGEQKAEKKETEAENNDDKFRLRDVLKRVYVWAFVAYMLTYFTVYYSAFSVTPFFMKEVLNVDAAPISYLGTTVSFVLAVSTIAYSWVFQRLDKYLSWLTCRLAFMIVPMIIQIVLFVAFPKIQTFEGASFLIIVSALASASLFSGSVMTANVEMDPVNSAFIYSGRMDKVLLCNCGIRCSLDSKHIGERVAEAERVEEQS
eukprot:sb/3464790/